MYLTRPSRKVQCQMSIRSFFSFPLRPFKTWFLRAISSDSWLSRRIASAFHVHWHYSGAWTKNTYMGYPIQQSPLDLHAYQEVIHRVRPDFILQTGIAYGGSLLYLAHVLDGIKADPAVKVIGIDVEILDCARKLDHPRITMIEGSSTDREIVDQVFDLTKDCSNGIVSLDSDHSMAHVADEIDMYRELVGIGSYLIIEDEDLNGHPVLPSYGPGPWEAAREFEATDERFIKDDEVWRHNRITAHGWYRRLREYPTLGHVPAGVLTR